MAEEQRTWAEIQTIIPDNTSLEVSPRDQRDALISMRPNLGLIYQLGNGSETAIASTGAYYIVNLSGTSLSGLEYLMDSPVSGRLRYTGAKTRTFLVRATVSVQGGVGATYPASLGFEIQKNGVTGTGTGSENRASIHVNGMATNIVCEALVSLAQNDYVELAVRNTSYAENVLIQYFNLKALGFVA